MSTCTDLATACDECRPRLLAEQLADPLAHKQQVPVPDHVRKVNAARVQLDILMSDAEASGLVQLSPLNMPDVAGKGPRRAPRPRGAAKVRRSKRKAQRAARRAGRR